MTLFFCLIWSLAFAAPAKVKPKPNVVTIKGKITDVATLRGIPNATISVYNQQGILIASTQTNSQGDYQLNFRVKSKTRIRIKAEKTGYITQSKNLTVKPGQNYTVNFSLTSTTPILSIAVEPKSWDISSIRTNQTIIITPAQKITVTNDGSGPETLELRLINPPGWTASNQPGNEIYVLTGLFCNLNDSPQANNFNQDTGNDDVITTQAKKATNIIFGYSQATANGVAVPNGAKRALYLQFKSPTLTQKQNPQEIQVIISCQVP